MKTKTQPTTEREQIKQQTPTIQLETGEEVVDFTAHENRPRAIVDLSVLQWLAEMLPKADIESIKDRLHGRLSGVESIEQLTDILADELAFHTTVNIITEYQAKHTPSIVEEYYTTQEAEGNY